MLLDAPYTTIAKKIGKENAQLVASSVQEALALIKERVDFYFFRQVQTKEG